MCYSLEKSKHTNSKIPVRHLVLLNTRQVGSCPWRHTLEATFWPPSFISPHWAKDHRQEEVSIGACVPLRHASGSWNSKKFHLKWPQFYFWDQLQPLSQVRVLTRADWVKPRGWSSAGVWEVNNAETREPDVPHLLPSPLLSVLRQGEGWSQNGALYPNCHVPAELQAIKNCKFKPGLRCSPST